jgi:hypothetical protein
MANGVGGTLPLMNAANITDKVIVSLIALLQIVLCALLLFAEFGIAYGGGFRPFVTPFLFFGLLTGGLLFSRGLLPRIFAIAWQIIFALMVLQYQLNATQRFLILMTLVATLYLCVATVVRFQKRPVTTRKSTNEAMR